MPIKIVRELGCVLSLEAMIIVQFDRFVVLWPRWPPVQLWNYYFVKLYCQSSLSIVDANILVHGYKPEAQARRCATSGNLLVQKCRTSSSSVSCLALKRVEDLVSVFIWMALKTPSMFHFMCWFVLVLNIRSSCVDPFSYFRKEQVAVLFCYELQVLLCRMWLKYSRTLSIVTFFIWVASNCTARNSG